jgi:outer membrane protein OmpA-like peptidoglycan-associated protein
MLIACVCWLPSHSQQVMQVKSPLQLADQYFAAGEYYTAACLYEQCLNPPKSIQSRVIAVYAKKGKKDPVPKNVSREVILYKQAESYRLAHYYMNADSAYKKCTGNIDALYWSAVCERSLGEYDEAEENIHKYLDAQNPNRQFTEAAENELQTLQYIRKQLMRPDTVLVHTKMLNTNDSHEKGAFAVMPAGGDRYLVSSTKADTINVKGVNPNHSHLFFATLNNDSLTKLTAVVPTAAGALINEGAASISADGNRIYFTQWKKQNGSTVSVICYTTRQNNGSWSAPQVMPQVNTTGANSRQPFCTADGKYLYFASDRPGGSGGFDIWYAPLHDDGSAGDPVNAGSVINTSGDEQAPFYQTSSGTLVFSSNGRQGMGSHDLFSAKGSEVNWSAPVNLGYPFNSSRDDIYFYAPEKTALLANAIVGSDRGCGCCLESYFISKAPKAKRLNGLVIDCKSKEPVADAVIELTDASGKSRNTRTDINGKYVFGIEDNTDKEFTISVSKSSWHDTAAAVKVIKTDESNVLKDELYNADICLDKIIEKKLVLKPENVVTVYFDFDKSILKPQAVHKLDSVYDVLVQNPSATLQISGYTDGKGSVEYNKKLSDRRARACADYFIHKGIEAGRITFESFGACCPLEMEIINGRDNPDGRSRNRRALINISKE